MDIYSKIFVINIVLFFTTILMLRIFGDTRPALMGDILDDKWYDLLLGLWGLITLLSVPSIVIYLVIV